MFQARQGDIYFRQIAPEKLTNAAEAGVEIPRQNGRIVIALGETTGHAHAVVDEGVQFRKVTWGELLMAPAPFEVVHEEHGPLSLPAGTYEVIRQREFVPEVGSRMVID